MTNEMKQDFTRRITQADSAQMVVIIYEILNYYLGEAGDHLEEKRIDEFHESIRHATGCLRELIASINPESSLKGNLLSLYVYCTKVLASADLHHRKEELDVVKDIVNRLYEAYRESVKDFKGDPVMKNTETVYAGLTYGKEDLIVNINSADPNRGFKA
ncbi:MAG: flagellar protein FliS [Lachnospiraceae bacterium]|nr:flagellar protein FliS [Lachnospiraceae bacterium]